MFENKNINTKVSESEKNLSSSTQTGQIDVAQLIELDELSYSKTLNSSISLLQKKANTSGNNNRLYQLQEKAFSKEIYGNSSNSVIQRKGLPNNLQNHPHQYIQYFTHRLYLRFLPLKDPLDKYNLQLQLYQE